MLPKIISAILGFAAVGIFIWKFKETQLCRPWIILAVAGGVGYAAYWILKQLFARFLWKWSHRKGLFSANLPLSNNPNSGQNSDCQKKIEIKSPPKASKPSKITHINLYIPGLPLILPRMTANKHQWEDIRYLSHSMQLAPVEGGVCRNGTGLKKDDR